MKFVHYLMSSRKALMVTACFVVLAALAIYINRDWFTRKPIQLTHRVHRFGGRFGDPSGVAPLMFELDRPTALTCVKVVAVSELKTNKYAHPLWHLVADPRSQPLKGFLYGMQIPGMRPAVPGAIAGNLAFGSTYRLLIEAGSLKAEHDFDLDSTFR